MERPNPLDQYHYGEYLTTEGGSLIQKYDDWNAEARRMQADFPYLQEIRIHDPPPDVHLPPSARPRAQGKRQIHMARVTEADEMAARLNAGPRSKLFIPPRPPDPEPTTPPRSPGSARRLRPLQILLDHSDIKRKVIASEIHIRESLFDNARRLRKITDRELRKQARANGPTYHFWRELTGLKPLGGDQVLFP